jgi:RHS repeat-associated protein
LYRLTAADYYYTNEFYHYTYDAVGNRLTASDQLSETSYQYDAANRLTTAGGNAYTFDANGNLLSDGVNSYTYDSANRLGSVTSEQSSVTSYQYNGMGDRLQQTMDGVPTNYTLDLNTGLTQVLSDGATSYTYGLGRISQQSGNTPEYFLGDALGSVRQLTDQNGEVTYAKSYDPYGVVTNTSGAGQSAYGYTGEQQDSTGMVYLRARHYNPTDGRFMSRDTWGGDYNSPQSLNRWNYTQSNPVNRIDPSGHCFNQADGTWHWFEQPWFGNCQNSSTQNGSAQLPTPEPSMPACQTDPVTTPRDSIQYDLTGYLALAMSVHGVDPRVADIARRIDDRSGTGEDYLSRFTEAYWDFNDLEGGGKEWDIKVKIQEDLIYGAVLCGGMCNWVDFSTPGNIHFGYVAYHAKIDQGIAAVAGGVLDKRDQIEDDHRFPDLYCLPTGSMLPCDDPQDQAAVDFGYDLAQKYPAGLTEANLRNELTVSVMATLQRPKFGIIFPHPPYSEYNDYYGADHFNN